MSPDTEIRVTDRRASQNADEIDSTDQVPKQDKVKSYSDATLLDKSHSDDFEEFDETNELDEMSLITLKTPELVHFFLSILIQKAYISLGLMPDPEVGRQVMNIESAKLNIDLVTAIFEQMKGKWQVSNLEAELNVQISNLQAAYSKLSGK
ncbi:MAG: DUF1844 domain-containing protein [Candidatus Riflebacteria bacterium]|nr:DUF1844 domain-containing protein [Candidatus Riflebacteria bacterium]